MEIYDKDKNILEDLKRYNTNIIIQLGIKYDKEIAIITIRQDFTKFTQQIRKTLKEKGVEDQDIIRIVSLIQNNYQEIYPDDNSSNHLGQSIEEGPKLPNPEISMDEWIAVLNQKYSDLKEICKHNFSDAWPAVEFTLSIKNILYIQDITLPFAGIILGQPSSSKTLAIEILRELPNTFYTDSFTPKSFVSHNTAVTLEQLKKIDLMPKIKNKLFMTPELGPLFSSREEDLTQTLGIITRILDGHGYESDSGAYGHRGYNEDIMFGWVGAAVDIPRKVYRQLAILGPKLYFYRIKTGKRTNDDYFKELKDNDFADRKEKVKGAVLNFTNWLEQCPMATFNSERGLMRLEWCTSKDDAKALNWIVKLGQLLAPLRGNAVTWETKDSQGSDYAYSTPTIEHPSRVITSLSNVAKGHALLVGRNYITMADIPLLINIVLSTAPIERVMVFDLLLALNGEVTASNIMDCLNISKPTALKTMTELRILGLVDLTKDSESENATQRIRLKEEFRWTLSQEFKNLRDGFVPEGETKNHTSNQQSRSDIDSVLEKENSVKKTDPHLNEEFADESVTSNNRSELSNIPNSESESEESETGKQKGND